VANPSRSLKKTPTPRRRKGTASRYPDEGTWFLVPLGGGFAVGLVARGSKPPGVGLAYFFGPIRPKGPAIDDVRALVPKDAVLAKRIGLSAIVSGEWPTIGVDPNWRRDQWPVPPFARFQSELVKGPREEVLFSDTDMLTVVAVRPSHRAEQLEDDGLSNPGYVEEDLMDRLR
jgi:hypothetical protein